MSVHIEMGNHAIRSDEYQWIIARKKVAQSTTEKQQAGDVTWEAIRYYPTLADLAVGMFELRLRDSSAATLDQLVHEGRRIKSEINEAMGVLS